MTNTTHQAQRVPRTAAKRAALTRRGAAAPDPKLLRRPALLQPPVVRGTFNRRAQTSGAGLSLAPYPFVGTPDMGVAPSATGVPSAPPANADARALLTARVVWGRTVSGLISSRGLGGVPHGRRSPDPAVRRRDGAAGCPIRAEFIDDPLRLIFIVPMLGLAIGFLLAACVDATRDVVGYWKGRRGK